jgi:hypothetical protein
LVVMSSLSFKGIFWVSVDAEKAFDKIHHLFMTKTLRKLDVEGSNLNLINAMTSSQLTLYSMAKSRKPFL